MPQALREENEKHVEEGVISQTNNGRTRNKYLQI
jgi:hypothetical protein